MHNHIYGNESKTFELLKDINRILSEQQHYINKISEEASHIDQEFDSFFTETLSAFTKH